MKQANTPNEEGENCLKSTILTLFTVTLKNYATYFTAVFIKAFKYIFFDVSFKTP